MRHTEHPAKGLERKRGRCGDPFFVVGMGHRQWQGLWSLGPPRLQFMPDTSSRTNMRKTLGDGPKSI